MKTYKLRDLVKINIGKTYKHLKNGNIPVYGSGGIISYVDQYIFSKESILLPNVYSPSNIIYINQPFWTIDTMFWTEVKSDIVYPKYLYFYLKLLNFSHSLTGSILPRVTREKYYDITVKIPDLNVQKNILDILEPIDSKIELNNKINDNLLKQCNLIYNSLFANGKIKQWEEGKKIEKVKLKFFCDKIVTGKTPPTSNPDFFDEKIPFITIDDLRQSLFITETNRKLSDKGANFQLNKFIPPNSLCVSCIATIGELSFTTEISQTNQQINSLIFSNDEYREYVYFSLKNIFKNISVKSGNIFNNLNKEEFSSIEILKPNAKDLTKFNTIAKSLFAKIKINTYENKILHRLINYLLPLLMNNQITIR
ncbi:restriction endonuclease subunit S [Mycoplasma capricolum subsp. capricolum]|uniref:restriction endonuclease subunit S n=1 Tax=Mycoplasma capricolum TaxID=2095 RepID=UPI003DA2FB20